MSGLKRIIEVAVAVAAVVGIASSIGLKGFAFGWAVDTEGKAATKDTTLRYFRDGGTIVGYDEAGMYYVYTPPRGWVCRFGETKKP